MKEQMLLMVAFLKAQPGFTDVVGAAASCRLYPGVANEKAALPFVVYNMGSVPYTKDARQYSVVLQMFFAPGKYTEMVEFADTCVALLSDRYDVGPVETDFAEDVQQFFTTIQFNI